MTAAKWTVGQDVVVDSGRGEWPGTVTKVGRKYITVAYSNGDAQFHMDGRNTRGYANPHVYTLDEIAEQERHAAAVAALRVWGVRVVDHAYGGVHKLTLPQIEALVAALPDVPTPSVSPTPPGGVGNTTGNAT